VEVLLDVVEEEDIAEEDIVEAVDTVEEEVAEHIVVEVENCQEEAVAFEDIKVDCYWDQTF